MKVECPVRPLLVVVADIDAEDTLELAAAEDEQRIEALATHAADPALGVGVRIRRMNGRADHGDAFTPEDMVEAPPNLESRS